MIRDRMGEGRRRMPKERGRSFGPLLVSLLLVLSACAPTEGRPTDPAWTTLQPGDPLPGLSEEEELRFRRGHQLFRKIYSPEEGLGPLFNENSCNACHTDPVDGGTGDQLVLRATRFSPDTGCDLLLEQGGDNLRGRVTPALQAHGFTGDEIPEEAGEVGRFNVPFLFGLGLVEAIPEAVILAREDPADAEGDGISGRASRAGAGRVARFGRKGHVTTLRDFVEEALLLEMGLTTPQHPRELGPGRGPLPPGLDPTPNPEVDEETIQLLTDFLRYLAPLQRSLPEDPEQRRLVERGEVIFEEIGCAGCHVPYMDTGPNPIPALAHQRIHLYSDLLLHDLGEELADVCGPTAGPSELRTEMLMGLGRRTLYLHDSRAVTLWQAIRYHGGEAADTRARFEALNRLQQEALMRFLNTL